MNIQMNNNKYKGIFPAFYACYDANGEIDSEAVQKLTKHYIKKGVKGLYVGGSSGECIYQSPEDRIKVLENVMLANEGHLTIICHVACNNTKDSEKLAKHAESLGVDAIASIPPIYFHLPEYSIAEYWNSISKAAPNTDFIIYNIPQLAGTALTSSLLKIMLENPRVIGVKNSSMPVQDIQIFKALGGPNFTVFNGPDEQLTGGLSMGADGGIGGTYGVMPELILKIFQKVNSNQIKEACEIQYVVNDIISTLCSGHGSMYAIIKEVLRINENINIGGVRSPFTNLNENDIVVAQKAASMITDAIKKFA